MRPAEIVDLATLQRFLSIGFSAVPGEEGGVLHVAAVWRPPGEDRNIVLRIVAQTPKSEIDFLMLNLARARAEAIVTTGRILREETELTHDLQGPPGVRHALHQWRSELGLARAPWLLILTSGRDFDPSHPALRARVRPIVFCPASREDEVSSVCAGRPIEVVGHPEPSLRGAIAYLRAARGARRISIEAGPSTAIEAYREPPLVEELLLSVFAEPSIPPAIAGGELPSRAEIEHLLGPRRGAFAVEEASGCWRFERYRWAG